MVIFRGISVVVVVVGSDACLLSMVRVKACFVSFMDYNAVNVTIRSSNSTNRKGYDNGVAHSRPIITKRENQTIFSKGRETF